MKRVNQIIILLNLVVLTALAISSCGKAYSNSAYAETIMSNMPGYTCFLIRDETGSGVGGNCLKD